MVRNWTKRDLDAHWSTFLGCKVEYNRTYRYNKVPEESQNVFAFNNVWLLYREWRRILSVIYRESSLYRGSTACVRLAIKPKVTSHDSLKVRRDGCLEG